MFLSYASSAFVPVRTMPWWLRGFARHQPATPVTETLRGLLLGQPAGGRLTGGLPAGGLPPGGQLAAALAWSAGILAASVLLSMVLFRRRTA
jgi:ABC-2 type transport system permease protein